MPPVSNVVPLPRQPIPEPQHWRQVLTPCEASTLALVALGWTNKEVAEGHVVTEQTVKFHMQHVLRKIGARNRVEAARWWWQHVEAPTRAALTEADD